MRLNGTDMRIAEPVQLLMPLQTVPKCSWCYWSAYHCCDQLVHGYPVLHHLDSATDAVCHITLQATQLLYSSALLSYALTYCDYQHQTLRQTLIMSPKSAVLHHHNKVTLERLKNRGAPGLHHFVTKTDCLMKSNTCSSSIIMTRHNSQQLQRHT